MYTIPNPYPFPSGSSTQTVQVTQAASANVAASVPVYGSLKAQVGTSGVDKETIGFTNFGVQNKREDSVTFSIPTALSRLSENDKKALLAATTDPNVICTYFNTYYVMQTLTMNVEHSKQVNDTASITAATIFTANGAYNYQSDSTKSATLSNKVLNVWGDNFRVTKDPASTATNTILVYQPQNSQPPAGSGAAAATRPGA